MAALIRSMKHELRIMVFVFLAIILYSLFLPQNAFAQTVSSLPTTVSPTSPIYTDLLVHNLFHTFSCLAVGQSVIGQPCLNYIQGVPYLSQVNTGGGVLGTTTSLIGALYTNPPIRSIDYLASVGEGLGIVKEANAQVVGSGAAVLSPILILWQVSRNISYVVMIVIFVIIGLMVMFRTKINPQTVITAQAALPGLVIGLILITFSYFLAALISDTAFIGVNVVGYYFSAAQPGSSPKLIDSIATENVGSIFSKFVGMIGSGDIAGLLNSVLHSLDGGVQFWVRFFAGILGFQAGASLGGPVGSLVGVGVCAPLAAATGPLALAIVPFCASLATIAGQVAIGGLLGGITYGFPGETFGLVLYFVAIAVLIYTMFKLLLRLINSYLTIIFLTISAPFQFLAAALPGRQGLATDWVMNMLANVLAFPAVFAVFYFVAYLLGPQSASGGFFGITNQLGPAGSQTFPLFGGMDLSFIRILLAFGALLATPAIPDIIARTIGKVSQAGQLIGQEITGSTRAGQGYAGRVGAVPGQLSGTIGQYTQQFGPKRTITPGGPTGTQVVIEPGIRGGPIIKRPI